MKRILLIIMITIIACNQLNHAEQKELFNAIAGNEIEQVTKIVTEKKININSVHLNDAIPLHIASYNGSVDVLKYFIENGANVNIINKKDKSTALMHAKNIKITTLLVDNGADVNALDEKGQNALFYHSGIVAHDKVVKLLLKKNINVNARIINGYDDAGQTPIFHAIMSSAYNNFMLLVQNNADIQVVDGKGNNLLFNSIAFCKDVRIIKYLIRSGLSINHKNKLDDDPFFYFGMKSINDNNIQKNISIVKFLMKNNLDINKKRKFGNTVLHNAVKIGKYNNALVLIKCGADKTIKNDKGETPLDLALKRKRKDERLIKLLQ